MYCVHIFVIFILKISLRGPTCFLLFWLKIVYHKISLNSFIPGTAVLSTQKLGVKSVEVQSKTLVPSCEKTSPGKVGSETL